MPIVIVVVPVEWLVVGRFVFERGWYEESGLIHSLLRVCLGVTLPLGVGVKSLPAESTSVWPRDLGDWEVDMLTIDLSPH